MMVDTEPTVAVATLADLDPIIELERTGFEESERWSRASWHSQLSEPSLRVLISTAAVEQTQHQLDGVIALRLTDGTAELDRIVVAPAARRSGVARRLIAAGLAEASAAAAEQMILEVRSDNVPALRLYRTAGFKELTVRKDYYGPGKNAVIMQLIMTSSIEAGLSA
jgi:ribosomal-protein-alanine N-acetyltransferase